MAHPNFGIHEQAPQLNERRLMVRGDLDLATAPLLRQRLARFHDERVPLRLNLSKVSFIDSTGVRVIAQAIKTANSDGWRFQIEPNLAPQVESALRVVKLHPASSNNT